METRYIHTVAKDVRTRGLALTGVARTLLLGVLRFLLGTVMYVEPLLWMNYIFTRPRF